MRDLTGALGEWIGTSESFVIGQVLVERVQEGFTLRHHADAQARDLERFEKPEDARRISLHTADGSYRPLHTQPNLRRHWLLVVPSLAELRVALDFFYPAAIGLYFNREAGAVHEIPLRETLGRQSGMYAVTKKISDTEAQSLIGGFCEPECGCVKKILWKISEAVSISTLPASKFDLSGGSAAGLRNLPVLCHEACNLLIARAREALKTSDK